MIFRLVDIAERIGAKIVADDDQVAIQGVAALDSAKVGDISFLSNLKYAQQAIETRASALILAKNIPEIRTAKLITPNPYLGWARTLELFVPDRSDILPCMIHATAQIHASAQIAENVHIGAHAVVGQNSVIGNACKIHSGVVIEENCRIADNVEIHPNAVIHYGTSIDRNCVIWSNATIGAYGFGNARDGAHYVPIPQLGNVIIEQDVSIGAGSTIDRGAIGNTVIKRGAKIDNLVMIAHNVEIGEDTAIASQTGISGSTKVGDRVIIAGQAGFVGHVEIGSDSFIGAKAGISKSFPDGSKISGYPARNLMEVRRSDAAITKLPDLIKKVKELENQIEALKSEQKH